MKSAIKSLSALLLVLVCASTSAAAFELVMVEQEGCHWCARWNSEIAGIYPKTEEGRVAPLRRVDLHQPLAEDLKFDSRVVFTPTFVLVDEGQEIGRLEGYPGEDMFWWMLSRVFAESKPTSDVQGASQ